jgi:PAS domain S-box-containing protein
MSFIGLVKARNKYVVLGACLVVVLLLAVVVTHLLLGARTPAGVASLGEAERGWLAEKGQLRLAGRVAEPPFGFSEGDGAYQGYEVDLAEALGPVLGVGVEVRPMTREEALAALANGEVDAVMGMVQTPENGDELDFTQPYVSSSLAIFVRSDRFDVARLQDLRGQQVAVQADTAAQTMVAAESEVSPVLVQTADEGVRSVQEGKVTAFVGDEIAVLRAVQEANLENEIKIVGLPQQTVGYAFAVPQHADTEVAVLNYGLAAIETLGLKQQVDRRWLGVPLAAGAAARGGTSVTAVLTVLVAGLFLGNAGYFLLKRRGRPGERGASLEESREKYNKLVEETDEAVFTLGGDLGLLEVNNRAESLTGYPRDTLLRMNITDLVSPAHRKAVEDGLESAFREGVATLEGVSFLDRLGDEVPVRLSAHTVSQAGRRIVQCMARDVRERERWRGQVQLRTQYLSAVNAIANMVSRSVDTEEMLAEVLSKLLDLTRMDAGVVYVTGSGDGEMSMTPLVKQGFTADMVRRVGWPDGPRRLAVEVAQAGRVVVAGEQAPPLHAGTAAGGREAGSRAGVPLASRDHVYGVVNIYGREPRRFTDEDTSLLATVGNQIGVAIENAQLIHRLQRSVSEVGAMRRFSESVLQDMTNGLVVVDREGRVRLVNRAGESLLDCKETDVLDSPVEDLLGRGASIVRDSMERQLAYPGVEIQVRRDGGGRLPLGMSVSPLRGEGGSVNGAVVMLRDLRGEKELEEERIRLERLAVLGEVSAVMAHEIRNPLAGMAAGIQHLLSKFDKDDERHEALERIQREGERVNSLIEDILLISRPPRLNLAPCNIVGILEELVAQRKHKATAQGVEILTDFAPNLPEVRGDQMRLVQVFSNLVANAMEAMSGGGQLRVTAREAVAGDGQMRHIEVVIEDNGVGIKEEELPKIFQPFYTTKARGTGLGLPIAQRIIEEHKGELTVESKEGEGTRVTVRLPLPDGAGR